jgi:hypothetical protein
VVSGPSAGRATQALPAQVGAVAQLTGLGDPVLARVLPESRVADPVESRRQGGEGLAQSSQVVPVARACRLHVTAAGKDQRGRKLLQDPSESHCIGDVRQAVSARVSALTDIADPVGPGRVQATGIELTGIGEPDTVVGFVVDAV